MKKLFLILSLIFVIVVTSCDVETPTNENDEVTSNKIEKIIYEGHEYLIFREGYGDWSTAGFTHSGNCPCLKNNSINNQ